MRRLTIILALIFISCYLGLSQPIELVKGGYRNMQEFKKQQPFYDDITFIFKKSAESRFIYTVSSPDKIREGKVFKQLWGVYDDTTLYLNCKIIGMGRGFIKIRELGVHSYFIGRPIKSVEQLNRISNYSFAFGLVGGAIATAKANNDNAGNIHYVFNLNNGVTKLLDQDWLFDVLRDEPELWNQFKLEQDKESVQVLKKYLKLLNQRTKPYFYTESSE